MRQIDYIKLKLDNVDKINTDYLVEHPTIKNRYNLDVCKDDKHSIFGNNIDVYFNNSTLYVNCSVPYLMYGHNFVEIRTRDVEVMMDYVSNLLCVDLLQAQVIDFEVAVIKNCTISFNKLIKSISSVENLELQKKTKGFVAYGKDRLQFKIYNVYKNLKRKIPSEIFNSLKNLTQDTVKFEIKLTNYRQYNLSLFLQFGASIAFSTLEEIMEKQISMTGSYLEQPKFDDILYNALLQTSCNTEKNVSEIVLDIIDTSDLSHVQKSRRRSALREKHKKFHNPKTVSINDFLMDDVVSPTHIRDLQAIV